MALFPIPAPAFNGNSRAVTADNAFEWLKHGGALFIVNPGLWIALTLVLIIVMLGLYIAPLIGALATNLLTPIFGAGLLHVSKKTANDETPEITDLFVGFKKNRNTNSLLLLGVLYMAALQMVFFIVFILGGGSLARSLITDGPTSIAVALGGLLLAMLLSVAFFVPLFMAMWFAPALVFFNNMPPLKALRASFNAYLKNIVPFLVYGLIVMALMFFAALPAGLGFLVLIPILAGSAYASYRDIFVAN